MSHPAAPTPAGQPDPLTEIGRMRMTGVGRDLTAGLTVFLVAVPLCLGLAVAVGAPPFAGLIAGVVGGLVVGALSGSHTSVSGPTIGLSAFAVAQIAALGSYPAFMAALVLAGVIQIGLGLGRGGVLAAFVPASVVKGFLAAVGILLVLKQLPHVVGDDADPEGDFEFLQWDHRNTFSELVAAVDDLHLGAAVIGVVSVALLAVWGRVKALKNSPAPAPLVVVAFGVLAGAACQRVGGDWAITPNHFIQMPADGLSAALRWPDFHQWLKPGVYVAALTIAAAMSLETLLNLQAADRIDPRQRTSPPSRELWAQGVGNVVCGLAGGLPVTSVIVRSSVNISAGARTKLAAVVHGGLLLGFVLVFAEALDAIPIASVAAVLLVTGVKLVSPALVRRVWAGGKYEFAPFAATVVAIVFTDLLAGVLIGLAVSLSFILWSNLRKPVRTIVEQHLREEVVRVALASQVSFLNRASLARALDAIPAGGHVLLDARESDYIDPDILSLLRDFAEQTAPARGIDVSRIGFKDRYQFHDQIQYVDFSSRDLQSEVTPAQVLDILKAGHERFRAGRRLTRDLGMQVKATADGQHPLAVVLSCIDSRVPAELIFDVGLGEIFVVRIAGNVTSRKILGSVEYACAVAGAKLIVVMGHTRCGAVTAAVDLFASGQNPVQATGCQHITGLVEDIQKTVTPADVAGLGDLPPAAKNAAVDGVARRNVARVVGAILGESGTLAGLVAAGKIAVVGVMYDVATGEIEYVQDAAANLTDAAFA